MINVSELVTRVTEKAQAKGGRSKAKEITIAQGSEFTKLLLEELAAQPACEVGALLAKYSPRAS